MIRFNQTSLYVFRATDAGLVDRLARTELEIYDLQNITKKILFWESL